MSANHISGSWQALVTSGTSSKENLRNSTTPSDKGHSDTGNADTLQS